MRSCHLALLMGCTATTPTKPVDSSFPGADSDIDTVPTVHTGSSGDTGSAGCPPRREPRPDLLQLPYGHYEAKDGGSYRTWVGVRYAAPPTGSRRWQLPQPPACEPQLDRTLVSPLCPQIQAGRILGDEDCLRLDLWAPVRSVDAPVVVLFQSDAHVAGGGNGRVDFVLGSPHSGASLAARGHVVVTVDHRLGPFGFLAHPALAEEGPMSSSGNAGLHDQLAALRWVQEHIHRVGGDPDRVLLVGHGGGASNVCQLLASPLAEGLFHAAALLSGPCSARDRDTAEQTGRELAAAVGCGGSDPMACLRAAPVADLLHALGPPRDDLVGGAPDAPWDAVIDDLVLRDHPRAVIAAGAHHAMPVLLGTTEEEASLVVAGVTTVEELDEEIRRSLPALAPDGSPTVEDAIAAYPAEAYPRPRHALTALASDARVVCPVREDAAALRAGQSEPVWLYLFDDIDNEFEFPSPSELQSPYGADIPYWFDTFVRPNNISGNDAAHAELLMNTLGSLSAGAAPTVGGKEWPPWSGPVDGQLLKLARDGRRIMPDPKATGCALWAP